mmetsp:Transcript_54404/g.82411  ORF Transcript_54404/g.82411 Transcript_54404/m.82411 type:complete len:168 (+) Transcript_54404:3-506(+)
MVHASPSTICLFIGFILVLCFCLSCEAAKERSPYEVMQLPKDATELQIKKQFRKLARKYHPDNADGDEEKYMELVNANEILSDPEKRRQYDQFGSSTPFRQQRQGGNQPFPNFHGFGDIFKNFASSKPKRGPSASLFEKMGFSFGGSSCVETKSCVNGVCTTTKTCL